MNSYRRSELAVGALLVLGYLAYGIPQGTHVLPLVDAADPLAAIAASPLQLQTGALLMAINSAAVVGVGVLLFPVLKRHDEAVAIGYLATRLVEGVLLAVGILALLSLVPLSTEHVQAGAAEGTSAYALGSVLVEGNLLAYELGMIALALGSLPFCYLLYRTGLVPRLLAATGLVGYPALFLLMLLEIFGLAGDPTLYALYVPGAVFEIGLALLLLVRGFDPGALEPVASPPSSGSRAPAE